MKKEILILSMAAICGMSSLVADECANCETPVTNVDAPAAEQKKEGEVASGETPEAPASETPVTGS